jgi:hypothetical protein
MTYRVIVEPTADRGIRETYVDFLGAGKAADRDAAVDESSYVFLIYRKPSQRAFLSRLSILGERTD